MLQADYEQKPEWLAPCTLPVLTEEDLEGWMKIGKVLFVEREGGREGNVEKGALACEWRCSEQSLSLCWM